MIPLDFSGKRIVQCHIASVAVITLNGKYKFFSCFVPLLTREVAYVSLHGQFLQKRCTIFLYICGEIETVFFMKSFSKYIII